MVAVNLIGQRLITEVKTRGYAAFSHCPGGIPLSLIAVTG